MEASRLRRRFVSHSPEATERLGESLGQALLAGSVLALDGELGTGKTALVRGLARGLGVQDPVSSPTFTLMIEHQGRMPFFHFDAWMAGREALFLEGGGADYLGSNGVAVIEWAERVRNYLPSLRLALLLGHRTPESRWIEIELRGRGEGAPELQQALERALISVQPGPELVELFWEPGEPSLVPGVVAQD